MERKTLICLPTTVRSQPKAEKGGGVGNTKGKSVKKGKALERDFTNK